MANGNLTVTLGPKHELVLEQLCMELEMSKTALLRTAIALYQLVHDRAKKGEHLAFTKDGQVVQDFLVLGVHIPE